MPVEVITFGLEVTQARLEALGAVAKLRLTATGEPFVTDSGNRILDCGFGQIADPARLEERIGRIVGVVESGLFIGRADPVFVADASGVHRLDSPHSHRGGPPVLVVMGVSGSGKTTVAQELAAKLGWPFEEGDALHPESNVAKMHAGIPLDRCGSRALARRRGRLDRRSAQSRKARTSSPAPPSSGPIAT